MHPLVKLRLSHCKTGLDALEAWRDLWDELEGYTFILSVPEGESSLRLPARRDFSTGGHLRSSFAHDHLYFCNNELIAKSLRWKTIQIPADYTVAFDLNVATYLRSWMHGKGHEVVAMLQNVLRDL